MICFIFAFLLAICYLDLDICYQLAAGRVRRNICTSNLIFVETSLMFLFDCRYWESCCCGRWDWRSFDAEAGLRVCFWERLDGWLRTYVYWQAGVRPWLHSCRSNLKNWEWWISFNFVESFDWCLFLGEENSLVNCSNCSAGWIVLVWWKFVIYRSKTWQLVFPPWVLLQVLRNGCLVTWEMIGVRVYLLHFCWDKAYSL